MAYVCANCGKPCSKTVLACMRSHAQPSPSNQERAKRKQRSNNAIPPKIRSAVRKRSGGTCERCRQQPATQMHHTIHKGMGGRKGASKAAIEVPDLLLHLCVACHQQEHGTKVKP